MNGKVQRKDGLTSNFVYKKGEEGIAVACRENRGIMSRRADNVIDRVKKDFGVAFTGSDEFGKKGASSSFNCSIVIY